MCEHDTTLLEQTIEYTFTRRELLFQALTHPSYANEAREPVMDNQRLEFLGDALLGAVITEEIFGRYPAFSEGELSKLKARLVCATALAEIARDIEIGPHMRLGKGEAASGGDDKDSLLADAIEALIAAVHLDGGHAAARELVLRLHASALDEVVSPAGGRDAKSRLQEVLQSMGRSHPRYRTVSAEGPQHARTFTAEVTLDDEVLGTGSGTSKKVAQQDAATNALETLEARKLEHA